MVERKKYTDVVRLGHPSTKFTVKEGDMVSITEKLDGANMSFKLFEEGSEALCSNKIIGFSRNNQLSDELTLQGAYDWLQEKAPEFWGTLNPNYCYFGEWLVKHTIPYPQDKYKQFYGFDVYDDVNSCYLPHEEVFAEFERIGLQTTHVFYVGPYISFDHAMSFVGQTAFGGELGEGVVIKNFSNLDENHRGPRYVKLVCEKMQEVKKQRSPKESAPQTEEEKVLNEVTTVARIEKLLYKAVDVGLVVQDDLYVENMGYLIKLMGASLWEDIQKEENEAFIGLDMDLVRKLFGKAFPRVLRKTLQNLDFS